MKTPLAVLKLMAVATAFACLLACRATTALASNNPIPGIDVVVYKQPARTEFKTTTDKEGRFVIPDLKAGTYLLSVGPEPDRAKAPIVTSHSNKKHGFRVENGDGVVNVVVTLEPAKSEKEAKETESVRIVLAKDGKITGTVVSAETSEDKTPTK
jgi:hypothetical protein